MMAPETQMNRSQKTTCVTFLVSLAYAIIRYCCFGDVSIHDIPLFVTNKAIAVTGLVLFGIAGLSACGLGPRGPRGLSGFG